ncbi:MAG: metallophosphoesterase [Bacteroidetes bacterium]|nr:metallophosphoesterase [Bacteroidota bacterium]
MRVAHISDPHFGRLVSADIQQDLVDCLHTHGCDAVLVTGDLSQRARRSEFRAARKFLDAIPQPSLVIPGNHDVHAWWHHPELRLFNPLRRYKKMISRELEPGISIPGLAVLGINTAHGLTIKGGRCTLSHLDRIRTFFVEQLPETFKILLVHHPLSVPEEFSGLDAARNGKQVLTAAIESGVDVVCAGHWHLTHTEICDISGSSLLISIAGTATSNRWRVPQQGVNSWNLIEKKTESIEIHVYNYDRNSRTFKVKGTPLSVACQSMVKYDRYK